MKQSTRRIGVLTGGGDCPGLNAVIRAIVRTAHNDYDMEVVGFSDGYEGLIENRYRILGSNNPYNKSTIRLILMIQVQIKRLMPWMAG